MAGPLLTVRARHRAVPPRSRRLAWGLVDQGLVSLAGAVLTVQGARLLDPAGFGRLATALAGYYVLLSVNRGIVGEVYVLRHAAAGGSPAAARTALRTTFELAVAVSAVLAGAAVADPAGARGLLFALAVALPVLLVQDVGRAVLIAAGLTARSAVSSGVVVAGQLAGGLGLHLAGAASAPALFLVWSAAALLGTLTTGLLTGRPAARAARSRGGSSSVRAPAAARGGPVASPPPAPRVGGAQEWLRGERERWPRFGVEALAQAGASQLGLLAVAAVAGAVAVGGLRAATVLLSPLLVLQQSAGQLALAELSRVPAARRRRTVLIGQTLVLAVAAAWVAVLLAVPDGVPRLLVGASLPAAQAALPGMAVFVAAGATVAAPLAALRLSGAAATATRLRLSTAVFPVTVPALVAAAGGGVAAVAWTFGVVAVGTAAAWTLAAHRETR